MLKIFSLLALAVVVSASDNALSAPVSEELTKEMTSDPDASLPSKAKNIRGAEADDLFAKADGEERAVGGSLFTNPGAWVKTLFPAKSTNGLNKAKSQWTEPSLKSTFSKMYDPWSGKVRDATRLIDAKKSHAEIAVEGVSVKHYLRALLLKVKKGDRSQEKRIARLTKDYADQVSSLNREIKALDDAVTKVMNVKP